MSSKKPNELPENYSQMRSVILSANNNQLNILVGKLVFGITDMKKIVGLPVYDTFDKIMEVLSVLRTVVPVSFTWPMMIVENLRGAPKARSYIAGFGIHAYEIECGPHGGKAEDEVFWWETDAKTKVAAYGSTPEMALLRACLLLAVQHSFTSKMQSVSQ